MTEQEAATDALLRKESEDARAARIARGEENDVGLTDESDLAEAEAALAALAENEESGLDAGEEAGHTGGFSVGGAEEGSALDRLLSARRGKEDLATRGRQAMADAAALRDSGDTRSAKTQEQLASELRKETDDAKLKKPEDIAERAIDVVKKPAAEAVNAARALDTSEHRRAACG